MDGNSPGVAITHHPVRGSFRRRFGPSFPSAHCTTTVPYPTLPYPTRPYPRRRPSPSPSPSPTYLPPRARHLGSPPSLSSPPPSPCRRTGSLLMAELSDPAPSSWYVVHRTQLRHGRWRNPSPVPVRERDHLGGLL
jgi:hypothetical protein